MYLIMVKMTGTYSIV